MTEDINSSLVRPDGTLEFWFTLLNPQFPNEELPDPPYILIRYIKATPKGHRLLKRYAPDMIDHVRATLKTSRPVIFEPANGEMGNAKAQAKLEGYYLSCGFAYLPSSTNKWWMTWPQNA